MLDNHEKRPRFDSQTGQPIYYSDTTENITNEDDVARGEQSDSSQYRYTKNDIPYVDTSNSATYIKSAKQIKEEQKNARKEARKSKSNVNSKDTFGKRLAILVASALVFGLIAGSTAYGVYYAGGKLIPNSSNSSDNIEIPMVTASGISDTTSGIINEDTDTTSTIMNVTEVVNAAMPAIVAINGKVSTTSSYGLPYSSESASSGTGIIVGKSDTELLIVTNAHVVDGVSSLSVVFSDNESVGATVKGSKSDKDIAVVAVSLSDIKASTISSIAIAELGDSSDVKVGEQVAAIGNALGEGQSVTVGWISALNRSITVDNTVYSNLFMTDAAINPGNSGGALINAKGQVIGINSAKYASEEVEGMGYSIPISSVKDIIDTLMNRETRTKVDDSDASYLGISGMDITSSMSSTYGYPQGIMVQQVVSGSAAETAGIGKYDIIVSFDDISITSFDVLKSTMQYYASGETVSIEYYHIENNQYTLKRAQVTLGHK